MKKNLLKQEGLYDYFCKNKICLQTNTKNLKAYIHPNVKEELNFDWVFGLNDCNDITYMII